MWTLRPAWLLASTLLIGLGWAAEVGGQLEQPDNTIYPASNGYPQNEKEEPETIDLHVFHGGPRGKQECEGECGIMSHINGEGHIDDVEGVRTKRFLSLFRTRATKSEGFKRGPGFRSWGGKRSGENKRVAFSSWGGKREEPEWQDKREKEYPTLFEQFQKKAKSEIGAQRQPFHTWGGKRNYFSSTFGGPLYLRQADIRKLLSWEGKRKFSSWGGKRSGEVQRDEYGVEKRRVDNERKKPSFKSWGGKRTYEEDATEEDDFDQIEKSDNDIFNQVN